jgi:mannose-6-phosphate isomerase-like protein (cupin superfamily)
LPKYGCPTPGYGLNKVLFSFHPPTDSNALSGVPEKDMMASKYSEVKPYITRDGSIIRELVHPCVHENIRLSLAEAVVPPGERTLLHRHRSSEEIYHITRGSGLMTLGEKTFPVEAGDSVCIMPNTAHCIENNGKETLKILCCCAPAYDHADAEIL